MWADMRRYYNMSIYKYKKMGERECLYCLPSLMPNPDPVSLLGGGEVGV